MNAILSLIVSLAMLLGGVGSLPAVPETANQYTLRNLTLTVNDETVTLDPELQLTAALGAEQLGLDFEIHAGNNTLLPISGRLDTNGLAFSLADNGKAYTLSYATLGEMLGLTEDTDAQVAEALATATKLFTSLSAYNEAVKDPAVLEQLDALNWQQINGWVEISGTELTDMEVDVNGSTFPGQHTVLNLSLGDIYASLNDYLSCDIEPLRDYTQSLLKLLNMVEGSDCADFTELLEILAAEFDELDMLNTRFPMDMTIAEQDGTEYLRLVLDMEIDGITVNVEEIMISDGSNIDMVMIVNASEGEGTDIEMSLNLFADEQNLSAVFDIVGDVRDSYQTIDADGNQTTVETSTKVSIAVSDYVLVDENGLAESFFNFGVDLAEGDSQSVEENTATISLGTQSTESREEDGSITADNAITLSIDDNGDALTAELAFQTNSATVPYTDAFAGRKMLELTGDAESEAYQQIQTDLYALIGDVMTLAADDSVVELMNTFAAVESSLENIDADVEVIGGYDYDDYDDYDYDLDMDDVNPATLEEAEAIYGSPIPAYTAPEGYAPDYIYADEGYLSVDYAAEDTYFSMTITPAYQDELTTGYYMLGADGALGEMGGMLVQLSLNEDGTVAYADIMAGDSDITIFFDDVDMATAEAILAGLTK